MVMSRQSTFPIYDRLLKGRLGEFLRAWRAESPPLSFFRIAQVLEQEHEVQVTPETVRQWVQGLDDTEPTKAAS